MHAILQRHATEDAFVSKLTATLKFGKEASQKTTVVRSASSSFP
jgi:hypothetical protein